MTGTSVLDLPAAGAAGDAMAGRRPAISDASDRHYRASFSDSLRALFGAGPGWRVERPSRAIGRATHQSGATAGRGLGTTVRRITGSGRTEHRLLTGARPTRALRRAPPPLATGPGLIWCSDRWREP